MVRSWIIKWKVLTKSFTIILQYPQIQTNTVRIGRGLNVFLNRITVRQNIFVLLSKWIALFFVGLPILFELTATIDVVGNVTLDWNTECVSDGSEDTSYVVTYWYADSDDDDYIIGLFNNVYIFEVNITRDAYFISFSIQWYRK